ncbi:Response regulator protein TodT [Rubripirellula obstinata]|uniref:Response regulator protein TodT n=2 Tax=Rubripirellula obstinata TaxID=406547 RepID=A0A5B1CLP9_9BACT|nr:Response regulator protein TodT [Rubripirellula obstinata]
MNGDKRELQARPSVPAITAEPYMNVASHIKSDSSPEIPHASIGSKPRIYVVEDDVAVRESLTWMLRSVDAEIRGYTLPSEILDVRPLPGPSCLIVDLRLPEMDGLTLLGRLRDLGWEMPFIVISGHGDISVAVDAMRLGAIDFLQKPVDRDAISRTIQDAIQRDRERIIVADRFQSIGHRLATLTKRETDVLREVVAGQLNKEIAIKLGIKVKTVETHRANVMRKLAVDSVAKLVQTTMEYRQFKRGGLGAKD